MDRGSSGGLMAPWEGWKVPNWQPTETVSSTRERREITRKRRVDDLKVAALQVLRHQCPSIYEGAESVELGDNELQDLFAEVTRNLKGDSLKTVHNFLVRGLVKGQKELGWNCCVPSFIHVVQPVKSYVGQEFSQQRKTFRLIHNAFHGSLKEHPLTGHAAAIFDAGQILVSLILNSLLLNARMIEGVPDAIRKGVVTHGGYHWLDLEVSVGDDQETAHRRCFPDGLTLLLLRRWNRRYGKAWPDVSPQNLVKTFLVGTGGATLNKLKLKHVLGAVVSDAAHELPSSILHFANQFHVSSSLSRDNWRRLLDGRLALPVETSGDPDLSYVVDNFVPRASSLSSDRRLLEQARAIITSAKQRKGTYLKQVRASLGRIIQEEQTNGLAPLIIQWLLSGGKKWGVSTLLRYLSAVGKPLIGCADKWPTGNIDSPEIWSEFYEEVVAAYSPSKHEHGFRMGRLSDFHGFLVRQYGAPPVEFSHGNSHRCVAAAFISPREYSRASSILEAQLASPGLSLARRIALMLGYRCGLRRGEVMGLMFGDCQGMNNPDVSRPELVVRANTLRSLKSQMARRRMPIWALLTDSEIELLREWDSRGRARFYSSAEKRFFFDLNTGNAEGEADEKLFKPVTLALQAAVGLPNAKFHDLRHSFANVTFLRLMETIPGDFFPERWALDDSGHSQIPFPGQRLSDIMGLTSLGRSSNTINWVLSGLMGHADPRMTFTSYVHLQDYLLYRCVEARGYMVCTLEEQAWLLDISKESLGTMKAKKRVRGALAATFLIQTFGQRWPKSTCQRLESGPEYIQESAIEVARRAPPISPVQIYQALAHMQKRVESGVNTDRAAELVAYANYGLDVEALHHWEHVGKQWMAIWRHHRYSVAEETRWTRGEKKTPNYAPILEAFLALPRTSEDQRQAQKMYERLVELNACNEPDLVEMCKLVLTGSFMYEPEAFFERVDQKRVFWAFLGLLKLRQRVTVAVKVTIPGERSKRRQIKQWANELGIPAKKFIVIDPRMIERTLDIERVPQIRLNDPGKNRASPWPALRYALLAFLVINRISPDRFEFRTISRQKAKT